VKLFRRASHEPLWRDEFAIHQADERYVNRRQFAKFLVLTSLAMFVGNVWIALRAFFRGAPETLAPKAVTTAAEVPIGGVKLFTYPTPEDPCILVRLAADRFVAYSQKCTHLSCAVFYEKEANRLECPCHRGYFSIEDGSVLQGPPPRPLPRIVLSREGETVMATGVDLGQKGGHA
jgi:Rieske Fe-S protein